MTERHGGNIYDRSVRLDFSVNLNPLGCPEELKEALARAIGRVEQYPQLSQLRMRETIAALEGVDPQQVIAASGASELFMALVHALQPRRALLVQPCFGGYAHALAAVKGCQIDHYTLKSENDFELTEAFLEAITPRLDLLILASPNNPNGLAVEEKLMDRILLRCRDCDVMVVLDECFADLSDNGCSSKKKLQDHPNLILVKAFTKTLSIPGLRLGYAISSPECIEAIHAQLPEWNCSVFAEEAADAACRLLAGGDYLQRSREHICTERQFLQQELQAMGLRVCRSNSCYLLLHSSRELQTPLLEKGILIRDCSSYPALEPGWYRIAVRNHEDNTALIAALKEVLL